MVSIRQKSAFSELGHVAYQIKGYREFNNVIANASHAYSLPHDPRRWGQNSTFPEHSHVAST